MIILEKNGIKMEVCTEVQASVFERNGYVRVNGADNIPLPKPEQVEEAETVEEAPKRRRRRSVTKLAE